MTIFHTLHVLALGLWAGLVATEAVVELMGRSSHDLHGAATRMHHRIDLLVELPVLLLVGLTGVLLTLATDDLTVLHLVKIGSGLAAICVNLYCVVLVVQRHRVLAHDDGAVGSRSLTDRILLCFLVGGAFASIAFALGFYLVAQPPPG
jgi:hypothetical protein